MKNHSVGKRTGGRLVAAASVAVVVAMAGCNTSKVTVPGLSGPSELALSLKGDAFPDVLVADGASTAAVQVTVRDQNGQPKAGQAIYFATADETGTFADIGKLSSSTAVSGPDGTAQVVYTAPVRTDFTANGKVMIAIRPIGSDANGEIYRYILIELRSAEGRLFPPKDGNTAPTCDFNVEAPFGFVIGQSIIFSSTASDPDQGGFVVRYFWTFGDASEPSDKPDEEHHYKEHGNYTVTSTVTDNNGAQATCTKVIHICDGFEAACPQP
jgi:PKD repeat protein